MSSGGAIQTGGGQCLHVAADGRTLGAALCDGSAAENFSVEPGGVIKMGSSCLQPANDATTIGTEVVLGPCDGSTAQTWAAIYGTTMLSNGAAGQACLAVYPIAGVSPQVRLDNCVTTSQIFTAPAARKTGTIKSGSRPSKCLDVRGGGNANGTPIQVLDCNGTAAQSWTNSNGFRALGKCLQSNLRTNRIELWTCGSGSGTQSWIKDSKGTLKDISGTRCITEADTTQDGVQLVATNCYNQSDDNFALPLEDIPLQHRRMIRDSLMNSWGAVANLQLTNWLTCPSDPSTLINPTVIQAQLGKGRWAGGANGYRVLNHDLVPWVDNDWNRGGAIHEFGHLLGFPHEQARLINQGSVYCPAEGPAPNQIEFGVYDPESMMNYCGKPLPVTENTIGWVNLSLEDVAGIRSLGVYGSRDFRRAMWDSGTSRETEVTEALLAVGEAWTSVDGATAFRIEPDGQFSVYRTDVRWGTWSQQSGAAPLPALWKSGPIEPTPTSPIGFFSSNDGILRVYDDYLGWVWQSTPTAYPGAKLVVQQSGNVAIVDPSGTVVWRTNSATRDELEGAVGLAPQANLAAGSFKTTASGRFRLVMQTDGNLVVYDLGLDQQSYTPIWASNTWGSTAVSARMMPDGTFVLLDGATPTPNPVWTAPFGGRPGMYLALREDGDLVAYEPAKYEVWSADTDVICTYDEYGDCIYYPANQGGRPGAFEPTFDAPPPRLWQGDASTLQLGGQVQSESGRSRLVMQSDGNLVFSVDQAPRWATYTTTGAVAELTDTGDFVVLDNTGTPVYSARTDEYLNSYLTFTDDGRLSIYRVVSLQADGVGFNF